MRGCEEGGAEVRFRPYLHTDQNPVCMFHAPHCDVEAEYDTRCKSLVLRIYLPLISYSASDVLYVLRNTRLDFSERERAEDARVELPSREGKHQSYRVLSARRDFLESTVRSTLD